MRNFAIAIAAAVGIAAAGSADAQTQVRSLSEEIATVVDIDYDSRRVLLQDKDGNVNAAVVSAEAQNLEAVKKGDIVQATTLEIQDFRFALPDETPEAQNASVVTSRDALPARDDINMTRRVVKIVERTPDGTQVRFREGGDITRSTYVTVTEPKVKDFVKGLKAGDEVTIITRDYVTISTIVD